MSTHQGVGGIEPAPPVPQSSYLVPTESPVPEESHVPTPPTSGPIQERACHDASISTAIMDLDGYYDVMVVGMSGMGKSTTSDKMVIAKLAEHQYTGEKVVANQQAPDRVTTKVIPPLDGGSGKKGEQNPQLGRESDNKETKLTVQRVSDEVVAKLTEHQLDGEVATKLVEKQDRDKNEPIIEKKKLTMHHLVFWTASSIPEKLKEPVTRYLKDLHFFREVKDSHLEINESRKGGEINPITSSCQLVSNEVTGMRVLDVPGFFSVQVQEHAPRSRQPLEEDIHNCTHNHLTIMREILRIQSTMKMAFRRILYFLPGRGPLGRQTMVLRQEMLLLAQYFGPSIFECMVLIATVQPRLSVMTIPGGIFSAEEHEDTRLVFKETLEKVLAPSPCRPPLNPPVVFISLLDTGKSIVEKIKNAEVQEESLKLTFDPGVCVKCSCTIQWLEKEKVECIPVGRDESEVIPYDDSVCHPIFLPRNRRPHKIEVEDGVMYIALSVPRGQRRESSEEICYNCKRPPGSEGCLKVGTVYEIEMEEGGSEEIVVDHTNNIEEHRGLNQVEPEEQNGGAGGEQGGIAQVEEGQGERRQGNGRRERGPGQDERVPDQGERGTGKRKGRVGREGQGLEERVEKRGASRKKRGACLEEEEPPENSLVEDKGAERLSAHGSPKVFAAEDNGKSTSELVVANRTSNKRVYDSDYDQPRDPSLHEAFGDMKGT